MDLLLNYKEFSSSKNYFLAIDVSAVDWRRDSLTCIVISQDREGGIFNILKSGQKIFKDKVELRKVKEEILEYYKINPLRIFEKDIFTEINLKINI